MCRIPGSSISAVCSRAIALWVCLLSLYGCSWFPSVRQGSSRALRPLPAGIEQHHFSVVDGDDVVGGLAVVRLENGDTLPDIARHFGLGINALSAANPGVDVWAPEAGASVLLPLRFILPQAPRKGIVVNLGAMRLFRYKRSGASLTVSTYPIGIGTKERPTPTGPAQVYRKTVRPIWHVPPSIAEDHRKKGDLLPPEVLPGPDNPLGEYALYLSRSGYLIHGTNKPASIGLKATNGCIRLYPEDIKLLYEDTPVKTPVAIVNQPYLVGQHDGALYLQAYPPLEGSSAFELAKTYKKLRSIEKKMGHPLDWKRIKEVLAEGRGIPVPILASSPGGASEIAQAIEIAHPDRLYGQPEIPELKLGAWYILAANVRDEIEASRIAAIINHQGPPIPARVLAKDGAFRVIAGPFADGDAARNAAKRLKIDLEIDGIVMDPARK